VARFEDYNKSPGYWFLIQLSIAEEISKNPKNSAKYRTYALNEVDLLDAFDTGINLYRERVDRIFRMRY